MSIFTVRQLDQYPEGNRRRRILAVTVLATLVCSYEAQLAPVLPLLLKDLGMDLHEYGRIVAVSTIAGAVAAAIAGRLTDRIGRVKALVPMMLLTTVCCLLMTAVHSRDQLLGARVLLSFVDGFALASTAPLIRDFSPRLGRAQAFGFWTWGPVGASVLAAELAAWTLPIFDDSWRSQFVIMAAVSVVATVLIAANIAELSPRLRSQVHHDEGVVIDRAGEDAPPRTRRLLTRPRMVAHLLGIGMWLVLYVTLAGFGQTMLAQTFGLSAAEASSVMSKFWMLNLATLIAAGWLSDRLQVRKTFSVVGTLCAAGIGLYLVQLMSAGAAPIGRLTLTGALLGGALGMAYGPWMASYSEDGESIEPRLQGAAWGAYSVLTKTTSVVVALLIPVVVVDHDWTGWLTIAIVCMLLFLVATLFFGGRWLPIRKAATLAGDQGSGCSTRSSGTRSADDAGADGSRPVTKARMAPTADSAVIVPKDQR